jgi:hypothetical protein
VGLGLLVRWGELERVELVCAEEHRNRRGLGGIGA